MKDYDELPPEALDDPFKPPIPPRLVWCLHCEQTYMSSLMKWVDGLWRCGMPGCDGAGYCFDIFDADNNPFQDDGDEDFDFDGDVDFDIKFEDNNK